MLVNWSRHILFKDSISSMKLERGLLLQIYGCVGNWILGYLPFRKVCKYILHILLRYQTGTWTQKNTLAHMMETQPLPCWSFCLDLPVIKASLIVLSSCAVPISFIRISYLYSKSSTVILLWWKIPNQFSLIIIIVGCLEILFDSILYHLIFSVNIKRETFRSYFIW